MADNASAVAAICGFHILPRHSCHPIVGLSLYEAIYKIGLFEIISAVADRQIVVGQRNPECRMTFKLIDVGAGIKVDKTHGCVVSVSFRHKGDAKDQGQE